ncbi:hypothetical protein GW17_00031849 [Ensete ventricosum]|nr:hypothetical protein GW17_00031849 [Ensete ventricosum]
MPLPVEVRVRWQRAALPFQQWPHLFAVAPLGHFASLPRSATVNKYCSRWQSSSSSSSEAAPTGPADGIRRDRILSSKLYFDVPPSKVAVLRSLSSLRYSSIFHCRFM